MTRLVCTTRTWRLAALLQFALLLAFLLHPTPIPPSPTPPTRLASTSYPVASSSTSTSNTTTTTTPCKTHLRIYIDHSASVELDFLLGTILRDARAACGACIRLLPRALLATDLASTSCEPMLLAANTDLLEGEVAAMRAHAAQARARLLVLHYSDEHEDRAIPAGGYDLPRLLLRNYYSEAPDRLVDLTYLQAATPLAAGPKELGSFAAGVSAAHPPARRLWVPLGHTDAFAAALAPLLSAPTADRPLAWSWAGSRDGKWARDYFLRGIEDFSQRQALLAAGRLHVYGKFMAPEGVLKPLEYSAWLYDSRVAPCPNGGSAEQFRVWEALEAGAVPLLPQGVRPAHLAYVEALGLRALWVSQGRWHLDAAPLLLAAAGVGPANASFVAQLGEMQAENARVLPGIYARLGARIAAEVCAAAGLPCVGRGGGGCPATAEPPAPPCLAR